MASHAAIFPVLLERGNARRQLDTASSARELLYAG
jgi:hypothetical protein